MALVQWCSGYVSFLAAPLAAGFQVLNREQLGSNPSVWYFTPTKKFIRLAYRPGRTPVGCDRVCGLVLIVLVFDS